MYNHTLNLIFMHATIYNANVHFILFLPGHNTYTRMSDKKIFFYYSFRSPGFFKNKSKFQKQWSQFLHKTNTIQEWPLKIL